MKEYFRIFLQGYLIFRGGWQLVVVDVKDIILVEVLLKIGLLIVGKVFFSFFLVGVFCKFGSANFRFFMKFESNYFGLAGDQKQFILSIVF